MTERRDSGARHPLFRAMVLMGGSLALHCGGNARHDEAGSGGNPAGGAAGTGGQRTSGGTSLGGATVSGGTSGATGSGGAGNANGSGGSLPKGGEAGGPPNPVTPGPFDCPPAQWDCSAIPPACTGEYFLLPEGCACDTTRPKTPEECGDADWVCRHAEFDSQRRLFTTPVDFECFCAPHQPTCREACSMAYGYPSRCANELPATNAVLCDCAIIVLR
ncbi:MAG TPA: hypothetical protein VFQ35_13285 [Polyangiaceae bacterium]|nr:hypothetical protein [Polyangiaceae bacterium]